jgi:hypothetical protein
MLFLNAYEIECLQRAVGGRQDNLGRAVRLLVLVKRDVDAHSDGWAYWNVPIRACRALILLVQPYANSMPIPADAGVHAAQLRKAIGPVRAFYTRAHRGDYSGPFPAFPEDSRWA